MPKVVLFYLTSHYEKKVLKENKRKYGNTDLEY